MNTFKTIGNTIKKPVIKIIGSSIKNSISIFHRKKNNIKSLALGLLEKYLRTRYNIGSRSIKYLREEAINKYKVSQGFKGDKINFQMKSVDQMNRKGTSSLINMVSKSKPWLPLIFVAGGLNRLTQFNVTPENEFDDEQRDYLNLSNKKQKISLPFLRSEISRIGNFIPSPVQTFDIINRGKCKSSIENFKFTVIQVDGLQKKHDETQQSIKSNSNITLQKEKKHDETKKPIIKKISPFVAPFDKGIYISRINETHLLLFNRYQTTKGHLQVVPEKFLIQNKLQTCEDLASSYRALLAMQHENPYKSVAFFNSGKHSGASQQHRHFQALELIEENPCTEMYKVIDAEVNKNLGKSFGLTQFSGFKGYKHLIYKFPKLDKSYTKDLDKLDTFVTNEIWKKGYLNIMKKFEIFDDLDFDSCGKFDYNMILNDNWIMVALRKNMYAKGKFETNAAGLLGGLLVKNQESQTELTGHDSKTLLDDFFVKEM